LDGLRASSRELDRSLIRRLRSRERGGTISGQTRGVVLPQGSGGRQDREGRLDASISPSRGDSPEVFQAECPG